VERDSEAAGPLGKSQEALETISLNQYGVRLTVYEAYAHRGPFLKDICFYEYLCLVNFHRIGKRANVHNAKYLPFDESMEGIYDIIGESLHLWNALGRWKKL
jgi:hypothetical protein